MFDPKGFGTPNGNRNKMLPNYYVTIPQLINDTHDDPENILDAEGKPPPPNTDLVELERPPGAFLTSDKSPKSVEFPVVAIVK